jgi:sulfate adenylyltransferase subunit 1
LSGGLLRFATAGSVDDGKSTLIGRLLVDTRGAYEDQVDAAQRDNERRGGKGIDFALLTDGLKAEREQGITIDVAYRYFATGRRKFIIADAPGHEQYTRNMVTGASSADLMLLLVDARYGLTTQSRRHSYIAYLLGIRHFVVAINKMDLMGYDESVYRKISDEFMDFLRKIGGSPDVRCIPISALAGDMVVSRGHNMPWYPGQTVLETLETVPLENEGRLRAFRFPVQMVNQPTSMSTIPDFRGYMGRVASGSVHVGDPVIVLPSGIRSRVSSIVTFDGNRETASAPESVTLTLEDEVDVSRGDMISGSENPAQNLTEFTAAICWMSSTPMRIGEKYRLQHTSRLTRCIVTRVDYRIDVNTLAQEADVTSLNINDIAVLRIKTLNPIVADPYEANRTTGAFILIDQDNNTVAAGMIRGTWLSVGL